MLPTVASIIDLGDSSVLSRYQTPRPHAPLHRIDEVLGAIPICIIGLRTKHSNLMDQRSRGIPVRQPHYKLRTRLEPPFLTDRQG